MIGGGAAGLAPLATLHQLDLEERSVAAMECQVILDRPAVGQVAGALQEDERSALADAKQPGLPGIGGYSLDGAAAAGQSVAAFGSQVLVQRTPREVGSLEAGREQVGQVGCGEHHR